MSYQKQIHDYLNGDLSPEEEKQLFNEVSVNPVLREELAMQIKLQQTVQKDMSSNAISPRATAAIFSALHFTIPVKNTEVPARRRFGFGTKSLTANIILSGVACAAALSSFVYVLSRPSAPAVPALQKSPVISPSLTSENANQNQIIGDRLPALNAEVISGKKLPKASDPLTTSVHTETSSERIIPNEPIKAYFDIGKFSSVDYLTPMKIIGVADGGMIYFSDNGGKSWIIQASGTSRNLSGIHFIDTTQGIIVGSGGTVLFTDNAGREWHPRESGIDANLITIRYATRDTVFACGAFGTIIRSTSGGQTWQTLQSGTTLSLFKLFFENGSNGFVTGEHGITLETRDGGASWSPKK